jgi:hypothetical protein
MAKEESDQGTSEAGNNPKMDQASYRIYLNRRSSLKNKVEGTNAQMETGKNEKMLCFLQGGGKGRVGEG